VEEVEEIIPEAVMVADLEKGFAPDADDDEHGFSRPRKYSFSQSQSEPEFTPSDLELEQTTYYPSSSASALASSSASSQPALSDYGKDRKPLHFHTISPASTSFGTFGAKKGVGHHERLEVVDTQAPAYEDVDD